MKYFFLLFFAALSVLPAWTRPLSERAQISLLTSAPYEAEVFTVYGHAALRVQDPAQRVDLVFNYGLFSFDKPFFLYRFVKGETDYMLGAARYEDYIIEYQMRGSTVTEQYLNLTAEERNAVWSALEENYRPENREYRYNFFFDNCATRPALLIEKNVQGNVDFSAWQPEEKTFRDMINYCTRNKPWLTFGCDLVLGSPTDRVATPHEMMFLPVYLKEAFDRAIVRSADGTERRLVARTEVLPAEPDEDIGEIFWTPLVVGWLFFLFCLSVSWLEWRKKKYWASVDGLLFTVAGLAGCILFFLSFLSEHPCTSPNWNLLWLNPLQLLFLPLFFVKNARKGFYCYHFINFAAVSLLWVGSTIIPQHFNPAFTPLMFSLIMRSGLVLYRRKKAKEEHGK